MHKLILWVLIVLWALISNISDDDDLNLIPITSENADQLQLLGRFGRGVATSLDWHPDGRALAVGSGSGLWILDETLQILTPTPITQPIKHLAWSPDGSQIATVKECLLEVWLADFSENVFSQDHCPYRVGWSADGRYLWALISDEKSLIYELETGKSRVIDGQIEAWTSDTSWVFTTLWKGEQRILSTWDFVTGDPIAEIEMPANYYRLLWGVDDETVATLCYDDQSVAIEQINICHLNVQTGEGTTQVIVNWHNVSSFHSFDNIQLRPDGLSFAYTSQSHRAFFNTVWEINLEDGTLDLVAEGIAFDWSPSTNQITSILGNGQIITYGGNRAESHFFTSPINMMDIRPNHHQIATTGYGYSHDTYVWDINQSWDEPALQFYAEPAQVVQYTADGVGLIAGGIIGTDSVINQKIGFYDPDTGELLTMLTSFYGQELPSNWVFNDDYSVGVQMPDLIFEDRVYTYWNNLIWDNYYSNVFVLDQPFIDPSLIEEAFAGQHEGKIDELMHHFTQDMLSALRQADIEGISGRLSGDGRLLFRTDYRYGVIDVWGVMADGD